MQPQLYSIQFLRAIAATLVVYLHMHAYTFGQTVRLGINDPNIENRWHAFGTFGVDIFFVISGFIMLYTSQNLFGCIQSAKNFLYKRFVRIAPIYWFFTLLTLLQIFAYFLAKQYYPQFFASVSTQFQITLEEVIKAVLFIPYFNQLQKITLPLSVGWTLLFEMFFYVLFAIALLFKRQVALYLLTACFALLVCMGLYLNWGTNPLFFIYTHPLILEFLFGIGLALFFIKYKKAPLTLSYVSLACAVASLFYYYEFAQTPFLEADYLKSRLFYYGIPASLIVFSLINIEQHKKLPTSHTLNHLGNWSYSLYLCHIPVGLTVGKVLSVSGFLNLFHPSLMTLTLILVCIFTSYLSYNFIEKPIMHILRRKFYKNQTPVTVG